MLVSCHGRRPRAAGPRAAEIGVRPGVEHRSSLRSAAIGAAAGFSPLLAAAQAPATSLGSGLAWGLPLTLLAVAAAAAGAYALGSARARLRTEAALREAHAQARQLAQLQADAAWQTDALHRPQRWQGEEPMAAALLPLFNDPVLRTRLQAQRAFAGVRVDLPQPFQGSRSWRVQGVPSHDDLGAFNGFTGTACPLHTDDVLRAGAAALAPLLALQPGPALWALDQGEGWQLQACNSAAQAIWPALAPGCPLPEALHDLPAAMVQAFAQDLPGPAQAEGGWHAQACLGLPGTLRGLVLLQLPPAADSGGADEASAAASEAAAAAAKASQAALAASMEESDSFSFTVSHDLRAPIRVVEGFTRIVKEDYGRLLDRVGNDHLDRVLGAAARMNLMIDALLTLARLSSQPLARQPVNLSQLAGYVIDDLRRSTPDREVEVDIEGGLTTQGDPTLLRLVLENLLGNAWKYSGRTPKARISLGTVAHGGRSAYVVRDNGAGFDMRSSERLFGLFQRLHSASEFPGSGVGLASVRRIVRRHGGDIWAEAEPGRGAAFFFTLAG